MNRINRAVVVACVGATTLAATPWEAMADEPGVKLAGRGVRREAWDALQYKPFDAAVLSGLSGWSDGKALDSAAIKNKPVLLVTWAGWFRPSHAGLKMAQEVAQKYEPLGLIVVGVHNQRGFEQAAQVAKESAPMLRYAHDAKGTVLAALQAEGAGPDFFLIDRAGRMRFAGVDRTTLDAAAALLAKETPEEAAKAQPTAEAGGGTGAAAGTGGAGGAGGAGTKLPPSAYANVQWPKPNSSPGASNFQGKAFPGKLAKAQYIGLVPETSGKIVVLDFWATWCGPCKAAAPHLGALAKKYDNDIVVIGLSEEDENTLKKFLAKSKHDYYQGRDVGGGMSTAMGVQGIPHVVVISTDGVVRWQGNPHPSADLRSLQDTVAALVKVDPGLKSKQAP